jgi:hypothetical protein
MGIKLKILDEIQANQVMVPGGVVIVPHPRRFCQSEESLQIKMHRQFIEL